jgi:hypothetical protein
MAKAIFVLLSKLIKYVRFKPEPGITGSSRIFRFNVSKALMIAQEHGDSTIADPLL